MKGLLFLFLMSSFLIAQNLGNVYINCVSGIKIYVNNELMGISSSEENGLFIRNLPQGRITIKLVKDGFEDKTYSNIEIKAGKTYELIVGGLKKIINETNIINSDGFYYYYYGVDKNLLVADDYIYNCLRFFPGSKTGYWQSGVTPNNDLNYLKESVWRNINKGLFPFTYTSEIKDDGSVSVHFEILLSAGGDTGYLDVNGTFSPDGDLFLETYYSYTVGWRSGKETKNYYCKFMKCK